MSFTREADAKDKDGFFDHGLNFFKNRAPKSDDAEAHTRVANDSDPYSHVDSGKPGSPVRSRNYAVNPAEEIAEDPTAIRVATSVLRAGDPLAEVYAQLRAHGGVRFGAQRENGSWELYPLESTLSQSLPLALSADLTVAPGEKTLNAESKSILADALKKFSAGS